MAGHVEQVLGREAQPGQRAAGSTCQGEAAVWHECAHMVIDLEGSSAGGRGLGSAQFILLVCHAGSERLA
jgi:hypothetical protein